MKTLKKNKNRLPLALLLIIIVIVTSWFIFSSNKSKKRDFKQISVNLNKIKKKSFFSVLQNACKQLNPKGFKLYNKKNYTLINLFINPKKYEFDFANAFLTSTLEKNGGILKYGLIKGHWLELKFYSKTENNNYVIKVFYKKDLTDNPFKLAIILDDFGYYSNNVLDDYLTLDKSVTFAIIPQLKHSKKVLEKAKKNGRDCIVHLPMEPIRYPVNDPGENAIFIQLSDKEIKKRTKMFINSLPGCIGLNNHMGSLATADYRVMKAILQEVKKHNMFFIDSKTTDSSVAYKTAIELGVPTAKRTLFLDTPNTKTETTTKKIALLKKIKSKNKGAKVIVISHCTKKNNLKQIKEFISSAKKLGWQLVPVNTITTNERIKL